MATTIKIEKETRERLLNLDLTEKGKSFNIIINELISSYKNNNKEHKKRIKDHNKRTREWEKVMEVHKKGMEAYKKEMQTAKEKKEMWKRLLKWAKSKGFKGQLTAQTQSKNPHNPRLKIPLPKK